MSKEKQIEEMREKIHTEISKSVKGGLVTWTEFADWLTKALYNAGYRKQSEGEWVFEVNHYFDDYSGDLKVYATAHCGKCGKEYPFNPTVASEYVDRPDNLIGYADWNIDVNPVRAKVLQKARGNKNLYPFCPNCGADISI